MPIRAMALAIALLLPTAVFAAEPVFPPGSRIGIEAPRDMELSKRFTGFERPSGGASITLVEMPREAYGDLTSGMTDEALKTQGFSVRSREDLKVAGADGLLLSGEQDAGGSTVRKWLLLVSDPTFTAFVIAQTLPGEEADTDMRAALSTVAIRPPLSLDDQIAALPFRLGDRAGFRPVRVLAGNSLLLTEGPSDSSPAVEQPILVLAQSLSPPPSTDQRDAFARAALYANNTLKDFAIERAQGFRQRGADWHEIVARALDKASNQPVIVTQALRFLPDGYIRMVGIAPAAERETILPRFRAAIDSVEVN